MNVPLGRAVVLGLTAALTFWPVLPAGAKGPALTWDVEPAHPVAGERATVVVRAWEWTEGGEPDLTRPWDFAHDAIHDFDVSGFARIFRAYPPDYPRRSAYFESTSGVPLEFEKHGPAAFRTEVVFTETGRWVIGWIDSLVTDGAVFNVTVGEVPTAPSVDREEYELGRTISIGGAATLAVGALLLRLRRRRIGHTSERRQG